MEKKWIVEPTPPESFYTEHPELPKIVAALLYNREIRSQEAIDEFLNPDFSKDVHDPFLFRDMEKVVSRLFEAIEKDEKITIHGDYDADGVSASTILTDVLVSLGAKYVDVYLPHRETEGYGLNVNTINTLADAGTNVIITCDCGISNAEEVSVANERGMDVIITDHHAMPETLPEAFGIIHPKVEGETYPDKWLAGGGVAYKLMQGLLKKHKETHELLPNGEKHEAMEKWELEMVAIASVADMVPLVGESRTLTKYGLIVLNKTKRIGLRKMYEEAGLAEQDGTLKKPIDADTIGFQIAPRINAAGRINHANVAYKLMMAPDAIAATDLAFELENNNKDRRKLTETLTKEAVEDVEKNQMDSPVLFILGRGWSTGIIGLIASRLKEKYQKPTIAMGLNDGHITGSGRSVDGFNMVEGLQAIPSFFHKFGGHPMACGFSLNDAEELEAFKAGLIAEYKKQTDGIDMSPKLYIDAEVDLEDITWEFYDTLEKFAPFGKENERPRYLATGLTVFSVKPMGKDGSHLNLMVKHNSDRVRKTIGWGLCSESRGDGKNWSNEVKPGDKVDIVFEVGVNEWNGNRELQMTIHDIRKTLLV